MAESSPNPAVTAADPSPAPTTEPTPALASTQNGTPVAPSIDVEMSEPAPIQTPTHNQHIPSIPTPTHASVATPSRNSPHPTSQMSAPTNPNPHGSPTRVYLNQHVTPHLLEGMKHLVTTEPDKPLKWLSDFLRQKSLEIEGPE